MHIETPGVVLRAVDYKESDRILTVLTAEGGLRTVKARGCRRKTSPLSAWAEPLTYSQMVLFRSQDRFTLQEAAGLEQFWGLREDVVKLSLATYFADVAQTVAVEGEPNPELLSLVLNSFYALDKLDRPPELVRGAFDLKCMAVAGYAPLLDGCAVCGVPEAEKPHLHLQAGVLHCNRCEAGPGPDVPLSPAVLQAVRHVVLGDPKRLFSFHLPPEELRRFTLLASRYVTVQLEREFRTLDFYLSLAQT